MKKLIIIGAGGMGRTIFDMAKEAIGYKSLYTIKGFIDDNIHALDSFSNYPPILNSITDYIPKYDDVFVCSIGGESRRTCIEEIIARGGKFIALIHKTARIGSNVILGEGNYIGAFTTIAADARIGDFNFIQSYSVIGHDVVIGNWNRIDSQVFMVGGTKIGNHNYLHTNCMINHNVTIGDNCIIGAKSLVTMDVPSDSTLFSQPARRLK